MNDEAPRKPQRAPGKKSWLFTAFCCGYFLLGGWAVYKIFPVCAAFFAGLGFNVSYGALLFHLLLNYVWLIAAVEIILIILALARQLGNLSERYRRPVNFVLLIAAIGFAPMLLLAAFVFMLSGEFHLIGKAAQ
jgi:hypothetical protein